MGVSMGVCMVVYPSDFLESEFGAQIVVCCLWLSSLRIEEEFAVVLGGYEGTVM